MSGSCSPSISFFTSFVVHQLYFHLLQQIAPQLCDRCTMIISRKIETMLEQNKEDAKVYTASYYFRFLPFGLEGVLGDVADSASLEALAMPFDEAGVCGVGGATGSNCCGLTPRTMP